MISAQPDPPTAGQPTKLRMMIHSADGSMVQDFDVVHEKKLHLILVREGLDEFAHVHPELDDKGNATIEHTFPAGGDYFVYADHQPRGEAPSVARGKIHVEGKERPAEKLTPNVPGQVRGDKLEADVTVEKAETAGSTSIVFVLRDLDGEAVADLEPYLGALGHLVIVSADGSEYVHAHPDEAGSAREHSVAFEAHFERPGIYKGWGQFQRAGEVSTIPFVVKVD